MNSTSMENKISNIFETFTTERNIFQNLYDSIWESRIIGMGEYNDLSEKIYQSLTFISDISVDNVTSEILEAIKKLNEGLLKISEPGNDYGESIRYLHLTFHTFLVTVGKIDREDFPNAFGVRVSELMGLSN